MRSLSDRELRIRAPIEEIRMLLDIPEGETERMSTNQNAVEPKTEENPDDTGIGKLVSLTVKCHQETS